MEFEKLTIDLSNHNYNEKKSMTYGCGEIIITDNPPIVEFTLICLYCEKKISTFDDFRNHFLNEHYNLDETPSQLTRLKESNCTVRKPIRNDIISYDNNSNVNSINYNENTTTKNLIESNYDQIFKETISYDTSSNTSTELEPEIQIERYDEDNNEIFISNIEKCSSSENDTELSGSISWTYCDDSDNTIGSQVFSTDSSNSGNRGNLNKKKIKSNASSTSRKDKLIQQEKTIEIYKEEYIPEKPKFVLAAVNLPIKTKSTNDEINDGVLSEMHADQNAFPLQKESIISNNNIDFLDKECKPKFKFNNIKFRRQHNEKYYLSTEKTYNEDDGLFYCPECSKRYKRIETLRYHYLSHTGVPAPFQCSICNKGFPSAYKARIHFTKHTGERPFRCHLCPRVYRHKQQLKHHLESHINDSNTAFTTQESLNNNDNDTKNYEEILP